MCVYEHACRRYFDKKDLHQESLNSETDSVFYSHLGQVWKLIQFFFVIFIHFFFVICIFMLVTRPEIFQPSSSLQWKFKQTKKNHYKVFIILHFFACAFSHNESNFLVPAYFIRISTYLEKQWIYSEWYMFRTLFSCTDFIFHLYLWKE